MKPNFTKDYKLDFKEPKKEKLKEFLVEERDFGKERVETALQRLEEKANETAKQSKLGQWS